MRITWLLLLLVTLMAVQAPGISWGDESVLPANQTNLGVGLGIPYGVVGLNLESGGQTRFSGGLGWGISEVGWNVGVKHYLRPLSEGRGSASFGVYYGTNTYLDRWGGDDELLTGFSVGLGWTSGHFDIGAIVPFGADVPADAEEQGSAVKLYLGYRFGSAGGEPARPASKVVSRQGESAPQTEPAPETEPASQTQPSPRSQPPPARDEPDTWDNTLKRMTEE